MTKTLFSLLVFGTLGFICYLVLELRNPCCHPARNFIHEGGIRPSSGQQDLDEHHDHPAEESDERIQDAQKEETDDNKESVRFKARKEILTSS